ncbi:hypothetical protein ACF0H5_007969 [Mactra antiquata]
MFGQGGRGKTKTKLESLLRQDHSDVYFDNERLNDQLNSRIDDMQKEMHKHDIQRGIEIGRLRQEIREFRALQNQEDTTNGRNSALRPQTSVGHSSTKKTATSGKQRAQSAWARTGSHEKKQKQVLSDDEDSSEPQERCVSPAPSSVSTLRNTKTLRKYKNISASTFKENNRYPAEWYVRCLPASDAVIHNARKKTRGKSAPPCFGFLTKLREKEAMEKKLAEYTLSSNKLHGDRNGSAGDHESDRMSLICEEPVKPVLMSRRKLMEISNVENLVDRGPSRNTLRKQNIRDMNAQDSKKVADKVRNFCIAIEELKRREIQAMKEREEERRQEAQEKLYMKSLSVQEDTEKKDGDDDDDDRNRFR